LDTLNKYFIGQPSVLLLTIDSTKVTPSKCQYDPVYEGYPPFPHIYGTLNLDAVVATRTIHSTDGVWTAINS